MGEPESETDRTSCTRRAVTRQSRRGMNGARIRPPPARPCRSRRSSISACTASTPSSTASCASTTPSRAPPRTACRRLALTDLANVFGMVEVLPGRARGRDQADRRLRRVDHQRRGARQAASPAAAVPAPTPVTCACASCSRARIARTSIAAAPSCDASWFAGGGTAGLIALSGAHAGDVGAALLQGNLPRAERLARAWAEAVPGRFYLELQRAGGAAD